MNDTQNLFGKITFPEVNQQIENCWLRFENASPYLEVPYDSFRSENWNIITGSFNGLDEVTFYKCDLGGGIRGSYRRIYFSFMLENKVFPDMGDLVFNKVSLVSKSLDKWVLNEVRLSYSGKNENSLSIPKRKVIHKIQTKLCTISIIQEFDESKDSFGATLKRKTGMEVLFNESLHFDEINELLARIRRLILFLTHESPKIEWYHFVQSSGDSVQLIERSRFNTISGFSEGIALKYTDIKPHLETIIKNWIEKEKLVQVIELIQEKYMNTSLSSQSYFLNCCVALESFHLRAIKSKVSEEVKELIGKRVNERKLISELIQNEELNKVFNERTTDWKNTTFREKIAHFYYEIDFIKGDSFSITTDEFIQKLVQSRNAIAHEGEYLKHLTRFELFLYGKVLEFVVKIQILKAFGVDDEKLLEKFINDARSRVKVLVEIND